MRRRSFLRGGAGLALVGSLASSGVVVRSSAASRGNPSQQESYEPLGSIELPNAREAIADGETAYVATVDGYAVVDLSTPSEPRVLAERSGLTPPDADEPFDFVWDVSYDDGRLLVPAQGRRGQHTLGFALEDVSDPARPRTLATTETEFSIHNAVLAGETAYLTGGAGSTEAITIYDVAGEPTELATWSVIDAEPNYDLAYASGPRAHDLSLGQIGGRTLAAVACWDAGTWLVDVTDPARPTAVGRVGGIDPLELANMPDEERSRQRTVPPGNHHNTTFTGDGVLLVGKESWGTRVDGELVGGPSGIELFDVSDPTAPQSLASIEPTVPPDPTRSGFTTTAHNFAVHDGVLYSAWYRDGVKRFDLSDPADPTLLTHWRAPSRSSFWAARRLPNGAFLGISRPFGSDDSVASVPGRLYTFPDAAGQSLEPFAPPTTEPTPTTAERTTTSESSSDGESNDGEPSDAEPSEETTIETPGFGVAAGVAGLAGAGLAAWRRRRDDE